MLQAEHSSRKGAGRALPLTGAGLIQNLHQVVVDETKQISTQKAMLLEQQEVANEKPENSATNLRDKLTTMKSIIPTKKMKIEISRLCLCLVCMYVRELIIQWNWLFPLLAG